MLGLKLKTRYLLAIAAICIILVTKAQSITPNSSVPLPPVPENITITRQLEQLISNATAMDCSTDEEMDAGISRGLINTQFRWNTFVIFPDPAFNAMERTLINNALDRLRQVVPCIDFRIFAEGATPSGDYVHIRRERGEGCWSTIGRRGGAQAMNLESPGCMKIGTIMHEMIHSLGFFHEHSRPDRNHFVRIHRWNIRREHRHHFRKNSASQVTSFGVPYNPQSIMHFSSTAFSKNGRATITSRHGLTVGSTGELQTTDIAKLVRMYKCDG